MKKLNLILILMLTTLTTLGCSNKELSDAYNEEELNSKSVEIINLIHSNDFDAIIESFNPEYQDKITAKDFEEAWKVTGEDKGKFISFEKEVMVDNKGLATVVKVAEYENGKIQYTLNFNEDLTLEGLFMK